MLIKNTYIVQNKMGMDVVLFLGNVVWLDDITSSRALLNMSQMPNMEPSNSSDSKTTDHLVQEKKG